LSNKRYSAFKHHWEKSASNVSEEEVVFGPVLSKEWSRDLDKRNFSDLETFIGMNKEKDILLDIGCGPLARAEVQYSLKGFNIVGLDIAGTTLKKAKINTRKYGKPENVEYLLGDAEFLPFRENIFKIALCIGTISHLPNKESVKKALKEMKKVIKPYGIIYIPFWLNLFSFFGIQQALTLKVLDIFHFGRAQYLMFRGLKEINDIFTSCRLKIKQIRYCKLVELPWILYFSPNFVKKLVNKMIYIINEAHSRHSFLSTFSVSFEVTCENISPSHDQSITADVYYHFF